MAPAASPSRSLQGSKRIALPLGLIVPGIFRGIQNKMACHRRLATDVEMEVEGAATSQADLTII